MSNGIVCGHTSQCLTPYCGIVLLFDVSGPVPVAEPFERPKDFNKFMEGATVAQ